MHELFWQPTLVVTGESSIYKAVVWRSSWTTPASEWKPGPHHRRQYQIPEKRAPNDAESKNVDSTSWHETYATSGCWKDFILHPGRDKVTRGQSQTSWGEGDTSGSNTEVSSAVLDMRLFNPGFKVSPKDPLSFKRATSGLDIPWGTIPSPVLTVWLRVTRLS